MGRVVPVWGGIAPPSGGRQRRKATRLSPIGRGPDDVDGHHARARAAGAEIVGAPHDEPWGRTYTARDLDEDPWFFTTPLR